jgi:hypothetical protein
MTSDTPHKNAGLPTAIIEDDGVQDPIGFGWSMQNNLTTADACFPTGDGGQNPGVTDDPPPIAAAKKSRRKF